MTPQWREMSVIALALVPVLAHVATQALLTFRHVRRSRCR
jgi:hypothetical protein